MRWPFSARAAAEKPAQLTPKTEKGASGVVNLQGFLQELEYNNDLTGRRRFENFEKMRSSDGATQEALSHITAPVKDASWDIEPASTSEADLEVAAATKAAFFEWPAQPFSEYLDQALDYLVFGHMPFELGWQVTDQELTVERHDADPLVLAAKPYLTFRRFAQRLPHTIYRWHTDDNEELTGIDQQVWKNDGYHTIPIDASQLILYVNQKRGADFTGRSLLRAAYKHWVMKELVEKIEVVALERHGVGVWVAYPPTAHANDDAILTRLESILENIRAGARTYIVAPGPKGQSSAAGQDGYVFELLTPGGTPPDFKGAKEYHRGEIKGAMLVRFSELGHGQTGARATGQTQSEVWYSALSAVAKYVGEVNDEPIRQFVDANFRNVSKLPRLVAHDIDSKSLQEFADAHSKLVSSGAIEPDRSYRAAVREGVGMPPEDDPEAIDELRLAPPVPPGPPTDPSGNPIEQE